MINVTKTYLPNPNKYKRYIDKIFNSHWVTNHGPLVNELEERLKEYLGVKNILLVSNGTTALQIAYKALGLRGAAITSPFSFVATVSSLVWEGLKPAFADIDKETFCIDPTRIESSIRADTQAIVPVHVFGNACDIERIRSIANTYRLKIVYDASHAFGVRYKQKSLLNYGDISTISFHATKIFHTCEGGALVIRDNRIYKEAKKMIDFGITAPDTIEGLGINAKMNELQAAMGLCVLDDIGSIIKNREKRYRYYSRCLSKNIILQKRNVECNNNYSYFPIIFESEKQLLEVKSALNKVDIYPRRYFYPSLNRLPYLKQGKSMPVSQDISSRILCLPLYEDLETSAQDKIIEIILKNILKKGS